MKLTGTIIMYDDAEDFYPNNDTEENLVKNLTRRVDTYEEPPGTWNFGGGVDLRKFDLKRLPLKFGKVEGDFKVSGCGLETLEGSPETVKGSFDCSDNDLTTLEGGPIMVTAFRCSGNTKLTNLRGGPKTVGLSYDCSNCGLQTLEGAPQNVPGSFFAIYNLLNDLKGAPENVGDQFDVEHNPNLRSFEGAPKNMKKFFVTWTKDIQLKELEHLPSSIIDYLRKNDDHFVQWEHDKKSKQVSDLFESKFEKLCKEILQ